MLSNLISYYYSPVRQFCGQLILLSQTDAAAGTAESQSTGKSGMRQSRELECSL